MQIKDNYPLSNLIKYYGFYKGYKEGSKIRVVFKTKDIELGNLLWISNDDYYSYDFNVLVDLIEKGIIVK